MAPWSTKNCFEEHPKQQVGPSWRTSGNRLDALTAIGAFWAVFLEILGFMPQGIMLCIPGLHAEERESTFSISVPLCKIWANIGKYNFSQTLQIFKRKGAVQVDKKAKKSTPDPSETLTKK